MKKINFFFTLILFSFFINAQSSNDNFKIYQLAGIDGVSPMMSYVIRTKNDSIIAIDGGNYADTNNFRRFLCSINVNRIDAWFLTHPHADHISVVTDILNHPFGINIKEIYYSFPTLTGGNNNIDSIVNCLNQDPTDTDQCYTRLKLALNNRVPIPLTFCKTYTIDNVKVDVLSKPNPDTVCNLRNNSSIVLKFRTTFKSVIFLGDLGKEGGEVLIKNDSILKRNGLSLKADYVQMAHHGQNGVSEDVYKVINPQYCLWPTPRKIWDAPANDTTFETYKVRNWMAALNVKANYVAGIQGFILIPDSSTSFSENASICGTYPDNHDNSINPILAKRVSSCNNATIPQYAIFDVLATEDVTLSNGFSALTGSVFNASILPFPYTQPTLKKGTFYPLTISRDNYNKNDLIQVYPNPAQENVFVQFKLQKQSLSRITIFNITGLKLYDSNVFHISEGTKSIDLSHFQKGVYFINVNTNGNNEMRKMVVENE